MFDTMILTKIAAALCSALLVLVLGGWIADKIYSPAHHGEYHGVAWIETDSGDEEEVAEADDGPMLEELLASADLETGAKVFKKCAACHKLEAGANGVGPHLYAVVGRVVGSVDGFGYSGSLVAVAETWSAENLDDLLNKQSIYPPHNKTRLFGYSKHNQRANIITSL